jgi:TolA-binding protein
MKKTALVVLALLVITPALAQNPQAQTQTAGIKEVLENLWARLRAVTPRSNPPAATSATVTAGLRGIEATESELKPYWRDERQAFDNAQSLAEAGKFSEAAAAFEALVQANPSGALAPNARFGAALARAAMGERARAAAGFQEFLKRDPQHPLARDAEQALAALR